MALNPPINRSKDRRLYIWVALLIPIIVLIGFARTYYLKGLFGTPALPGLLVHLHGIVMTSWVVLFITQVWLVAARRTRIHQQLGILGAILAALVCVVGVTTAVTAAARDAVAGPDPLRSLVIPLVDMLVFSILIAAGLYFRSGRLDIHKRLMLLATIALLPAAFARFPLHFAETGGPFCIFCFDRRVFAWLHSFPTRPIIAGFILCSYGAHCCLSGHNLYGCCWLAQISGCALQRGWWRESFQLTRDEGKSLRSQFVTLKGRVATVAGFAALPLRSAVRLRLTEGILQTLRGYASCPRRSLSKTQLQRSVRRSLTALGAASRKTMQRIVAVIPARMGSSRFPGKPLAKLLGRPMIEHVVRRAEMCEQLDAVYVATCDEEIREVVEGFGGAVVMTSPSHERASDRVAEAAEHLEGDIIVMIQGDEPMITPGMIDAALAPMSHDSSVECVNLAHRITNRADYLNPNTIKVVANIHGDALYFSRSPIPLVEFESVKYPPVLKQVCVIPFRRRCLREFARLAPTPLERAESVDMLRIVEHGGRVRIVETEVDTHAVDTPEDLRLVEALMKDDALVLQCFV